MAADERPFTFLFTDIVGSTLLWQRDQGAMQDALKVHDRVIRTIVEDHVGAVFAGGGDGFGAVFYDPASAVAAALAVQDQLDDLAVDGEPLLVRIGLHTGHAQQRRDDYFGLNVNRAARLAGAAHGGQVLVSGASAAMIEDASILVPLGEHQLPDLLEAMAVFQAGAGEFPPIKSLDPARHNLPVRFTSFVGRDQIVADVESRLRTDRLVTIVGPGGIGKTSLALEVAARLVPDVERGVWLAELDELESGSDIESVIASMLGLQSVQGWRRSVAKRDHLIVLDNAEHLLDEVASTISGLLRAGDRLRFLVTSREPLNMPGESVIDLPPLAVDEEAVELFVDRSQLFDVDLKVLSEILNLTDGMPLVIELVAAHARRLPLEDVLGSLEQQGFGTLRSRGISARHQSSQHAIEWSYELLSAGEQHAFAALAVFGQDFTIDSAAAVAGACTDVIRNLIEKSLIHRSGDRYRLLEPIKEFAADVLTKAEGWSSVRARHADHVAKEIDRLSKELPPRMGELWLARMNVTPTDIIAAFEQSISLREIEPVRKLFGAVPGAFGYERQYVEPLLDVLHEGIEWLERDINPNRWLLYRYAWTERFLDRDESARDRARWLRAIATEVGDDQLVSACDVVIVSTTAWLGDGDLAEIRSTVDSLLEQGTKTDWWSESQLLFELGRTYQKHGRNDEAVDLLRRSLASDSETSRNADLIRLELAGILSSQDEPREVLKLLEEVDSFRHEVAQERAHALIAMHEPQEALSQIQYLVELDLEEGQPTVGPFCAAADYFREMGDHRASAHLLARMLEGDPASQRVHHNIIREAKHALGHEFDDEWRRGEQMDVISLYGVIAEG